MRWKIRKSFKIFAPGSSLRKRVAYSLAIVRLILVPVIFEKDLDALVKTARHEKRAQLVRELHTRAVSFDSRITEAIQRANPALHQVAPDLRASSQKALQLTSTLEEENWGRVQMDHQEARQLIHRAEWSVSIVSTVTLLFSVWASLILPGQVANLL
jgi:hypothetical protein